MSELRGILDPHLRQCRIQRQLAGDAGCIGVEDVRHDAALLERIPDEMRLGQVGGGVDPLQNRYDTIAPMASCFTPERPEMFRYERLRPRRCVTSPVMPTDVVM